MLLSKKKEICNIIIQFLVLEMNYSVNEKQKNKKQNVQ